MTLSDVYYLFVGNIRQNSSYQSLQSGLCKIRVTLVVFLVFRGNFVVIVRSGTCLKLLESRWSVLETDLGINVSRYLLT